MFTFKTLSPVYHDEPAEQGAGAPPAEDAGIELPEGTDPAELLAAIGGDEGAQEPTDEEIEALLAEPDESVQQFERAHVEKLRREAAARRVEARELKEKYGDLDPDAARNGIQILERLQTQEGVLEAAYATLEALGMQPADIETTLKALVSGEPDEEDPDLDLPMTKREWLEYEAEQAKKAGQTAEEARKEATIKAMNDKIVETFVELEVSDEDDRQVLLTIADQIAAKTKTDTTDINLLPDVLRAAKAEMDRRASEAAKKLLLAKVSQRDSSPTSLAGGGGTGDGEVDPPKENRTLAEVIADRRNSKKNL